MQSSASDTEAQWIKRNESDMSLNKTQEKCCGFHTIASIKVMSPIFIILLL